MIDPGALGTLIIGLEEDRRRTELDLWPDRNASRRHAAARSRPALAVLLRHLADLIEPRRRGRMAGVGPARSLSGDRR